jgi:hypothetical protein
MPTDGRLALPTIAYVTARVVDSDEPLNGFADKSPETPIRSETGQIPLARSRAREAVHFWEHPWRKLTQQRLLARSKTKLHHHSGFAGIFIIARRSSKHREPELTIQADHHFVALPSVCDNPREPMIARIGDLP